MSQDDYAALAASVFQGWKRTPRNVMPLLLRSTKRGLGLTIERAEGDIARLVAVKPPAELQVEHGELVAALGAAVIDTRRIAESPTIRDRQAVVKAIMDAPSTKRLRAARLAMEAALESRSHTQPLS